MTIKLSRARTQTVIRALRMLKNYANRLDTSMQVDDANEVMMECEHLIDYLQQQVDR